MQKFREMGRFALIATLLISAPSFSPTRAEETLQLSAPRRALQVLRSFAIDTCNTLLNPFGPLGRRLDWRLPRDLHAILARTEFSLEDRQGFAGLPDGTPVYAQKWIGIGGFDSPLAAYGSDSVFVEPLTPEDLTALDKSRLNEPHRTLTHTLAIRTEQKLYSWNFVSPDQMSTGFLNRALRLVQERDPHFIEEIIYSEVIPFVELFAETETQGFVHNIPLDSSRFSTGRELSRQTDGITVTHRKIMPNGYAYGARFQRGILRAHPARMPQAELTYVQSKDSGRK